MDSVTIFADTKYIHVASFPYNITDKPAVVNL